MVYDPRYDLKPQIDVSPPAASAGSDPYAELRSAPSSPSAPPPLSAESSDPYAELRAPAASRQEAGLGPATSEPTEPEKPLAWSEVPGEAVRNLPSSAYSAAEAFVQPFIHPITTAQNLGSAGLGALQHAVVVPGTSFEPYDDAITDFYKQR